MEEVLNKDVSLFFIYFSEIQYEIAKNVFEVWVLQTELLKIINQTNKDQINKKKKGNPTTFFIHLVKTALCFLRI